MAEGEYGGAGLQPARAGVRYYDERAAGDGHRDPCSAGCHEGEASAPDMDTNVVAVVVTVTIWPLAVLMTRLLPFTCSSVPSACWSWEHP